MRDELRDVLGRLDVVEDRLEAIGDRLDRMRARITSVQRALDTDDDAEPDEQSELLDLIEERRNARG